MPGGMAPRPLPGEDLTPAILMPEGASAPFISRGAGAATAGDDGFATSAGGTTVVVAPAVPSPPPSWVACPMGRAAGRPVYTASQ